MANGIRSLGRLVAFVIPIFTAVVAAPCEGSVDTAGVGGIGTRGVGGIPPPTAPGATIASAAVIASVGTSTETGGTGPNELACTEGAGCASRPKGEVCDAASSTGVACTPITDVGDPGQFGDPGTSACRAGCADANGCAAVGSHRVSSILLAWILSERNRTHVQGNA